MSPIEPPELNRSVSTQSVGAQSSIASATSRASLTSPTSGDLEDLSPTDKLQRELQKACRKDVVAELLAVGAKPNAEFKYRIGIREICGTSLTLAVKKNQLEVVQLLLEKSADPKLEYHFKAGRAQITWRGPAVCGTVFSGNLAMMSLLLEFKADVQGRLISFDGEPNATLIYEASYFGHAHMVRFLIQRRAAQLDATVKFQDDMNITFTALQTASKNGRYEVVKSLLEAKASISAAPTELNKAEKDEKKRGPRELRDAIDGCHVSVVRLLIENGAQLFTGPPGFRGADHLFDTNNAVLIAAAAKGLKLVDKSSMKGITARDFLTFLGTSNAEEIVGAVFQTVELRYWKGANRLVWNTAYIPDGVMNVASGPAVTHFEKRFETNMVRKSSDNSLAAELKGKEEEKTDEPFYEQLLPRRYEKLDGQTQVPIETYQCILPGLHRSVEVLWTLASGSNEMVFEELGARAIVQLAYIEAAGTQLLTFWVDLISAILFGVLTHSLLQQDLEGQAWLRYTCLAVLMLIFIRNMKCTMAHTVGAIRHGKFRQQCNAFMMHELNDVCRLSLTGTSLVWLFAAPGDFETQASLKIVFALTGFSRWLRVLNTLKGFDHFGRPMLPIIQAIPATFPFFLVVSFWFMGFLHMYYTLGLFSPWTTFLTMYRLGVLADFGLDTMGGSGLEPSTETNGTQARRLKGATATGSGESPGMDLKWYVDCIFLVMSLSMSIVLMNILIGVLSESYNTGWAARERLFLEERCRIVLQHFTTSEGERIMRRSLCPCCHRRKRRVHSVEIGEAALVEEGRQTSGDEDGEEQCWDFVWFIRPRDMSEWGSEQSGAYDDSLNVHQRMNELRREMFGMFEQTSERQEKLLSLLEVGVSPDRTQTSRLDTMEEAVKNLAESFARIERNVMKDS